jgi:predicted nucleotidyltransferase/uncharacterized protein (UPF0332 family)
MAKKTETKEQNVDELKKKIEKFKKEVLDKFGDYITGISLLPPKKDDEEKKEKDINIIILVDDTSSKKMSKEELRTKMSKIIEEKAQKIDKKIKPNTVLLTDVWQQCHDGKYELNKLIAMGAIVHDTGMMSAIKLAEVHKSMVIKKFEKYIMTYVLSGSIVKGKAKPTSDIDAWVVIDDTDVKKMSRTELRDKLRAIIAGMAMEAKELTGLQNDLHVQVYILTDFWDSLKEANPVIFTLLRDSVPFYDRGVFIPWKQMLQMGKIRPSREAIDLFMTAGEKILERTKHKLKEMAISDCYNAILSPSQAAIMLYGFPPPTPKETPDILEEEFVNKQKILEKKYVDILRRNIKILKDVEHKVKENVTGKELDKLISDADEYLKRIKKLFKEIEMIHIKKNVDEVYDNIVTLIRDVLKTEKVEKCQTEDLVRKFEDEIISTGKVSSKYLRKLNLILEIKDKKDNNEKVSKTDIETIKKESADFIRTMIDYIQRKHGQEMEKTRIKVKYDDKFGEVILLDKKAFIIKDINDKDKKIEEAKISTDGSLTTIKESSLEKLEKAVTEEKAPQNAFIKEPLFESIKEIFGKNVEILVHK